MSMHLWHKHAHTPTHTHTLTTACILIVKSFWPTFGFATNNSTTKAKAKKNNHYIYYKKYKQCKHISVCLSVCVCALITKPTFVISCSLSVWASFLPQQQHQASMKVNNNPTNNPTNEQTKQNQYIHHPPPGLTDSAPYHACGYPLFKGCQLSCGICTPPSNWSSVWHVCLSGARSERLRQSAAWSVNR